MRLARATVFAAACAAVSAAGHVLAGGAAIPPGVLAAGALGALALAYALNGRERGPHMVLGATIGAQLALHELFTRAAPGHLPMPPHDAMPPHGHFDPGMPLAHLAVAALTGWWLHRGESACWLMLRLWGAPGLPVPRRLRAVPCAAPARPTPPEEPPARWRTRLIGAAAPLRGPPAGAVSV
jgi:hypothetical protein